VCILAVSLLAKPRWSQDGHESSTADRGGNGGIELFYKMPFFDQTQYLSLHLSLHILVTALLLSYMADWKLSTVGSLKGRSKSLCFQRYVQMAERTHLHSYVLVCVQYSVALSFFCPPKQFLQWSQKFTIVLLYRKIQHPQCLTGYGLNERGDAMGN
jgi:hypothetical protein